MDFSFAGNKTQISSNRQNEKYLEIDNKFETTFISKVHPSKSPLKKVLKLESPIENKSDLLQIPL